MMDLHQGSPERSQHLKGILLMVGAGLCWSTGGIFVRSVDITNSWEIAFWRALAMTIVLSILLRVRHPSRMIQSCTAMGLGGFLAGLCLATAFMCFILAVMQTTVANALVIMSTSPFLAALFGRVFLGEAVPLRSYVAMAAALAGITAMCVDSIEAGAVMGNLLALVTALAFASCVVFLRRSPAHTDMTPTVLVAGLMCVAVTLPLSVPLHASWQDIGVLACMGTFQAGLGCLLMTLAAQHISAAEIGLLSLLETTLGPVWVWLGVGERPSDLAILGGVIVVASLALNELVGFYTTNSSRHATETVAPTLAG